MATIFDNIWNQKIAFFATFFLVFTLMAAVHQEDENQLSYAATSLFICMWIVYGGCHMILLGLLNYSLDQTGNILFPLITAIALADMGKHLIQTWQQRHATAGAVSKDMWAGFVGNTLCTGASMMIFMSLIQGYMQNIMGWIVAALLIGVLGISHGMTSKLLGNPRNFVLAFTDRFLQATVLFYYYVLVIM